MKKVKLKHRESKMDEVCLKGWIKDVKVLKLTDDLKYSKKRDINNLKELVWN